MSDCTEHEVDFIVKADDPEGAVVEDDIREDLAKIGIKVNTVLLDSEAYSDAERNGTYHMLLSRTWVCGASFWVVLPSCCRRVACALRRRAGGNDCTDYPSELPRFTVSACALLAATCLNARITLFYELFFSSTGLLTSPWAYTRARMVPSADTSPVLAPSRIAGMLCNHCDL